MLHDALSSRTTAGERKRPHTQEGDHSRGQRRVHLLCNAQAPGASQQRAGGARNAVHAISGQGGIQGGEELWGWWVKGIKA